MVASRKRGNGEGTEITKHSSGKYWQRVTLPDGKRKAFYGDTKTEVREKRDKYLAAYREGRVTAGSEQKLADYLAAWLKSRRDSLGPRTADAYDLSIRRMSPLIGHVRLQDLKPAHIRECYERLLEDGLKGKPLSKRSVQQTHTVLHTALQQALKEELLIRNPCDAVSAPRPERKEMHVLSLEQAQTLLQFTVDDHLHPLWVTLVMTGMRVGEAIALRWSDVDLEAGTIAIQRSMQRIRGKGLQVGPVKTHRSNRRIDVPGLVVEALRQHEDRLRLNRQDASRDALIFTNKDGGPLDAGNVRESLGRRLKNAGLPAIRVHDLRHTAASLHLQDNQHPKIVQELLGHSTFTLTMNTYSHLMPSMTKQAASRMDALFRGSGTGK